MAGTLAHRIMASDNTKETPVFNLVAYNDIGGGNYRAEFASTPRTIKFAFEDYRDKVLEMTDGKLTLAADSLFKKPDQPIFRGILTPQTRSVRYEEDKLKEQGFRSMTANLFEGERKEIWKLVGEGNNRQLVRVADEDYDRLLRARRSSMSLTASTVIAAPQFGDYAYAYIPELNAFDFGVYGKLKGQPFIASRKYQKRFKVNNNQVLEAAAADPALRSDMSRKWDDMTDRKALFAEYLDYLGKMYGKNSEYYRATEEAILNSRVM